ncbi:MAG: class I SAM-dependent rRNA methyltransferase [Polyangiales bacterium]
MATVRIRPGHVQPVWAGHPWIFAQAIGRVEGAPAPGDVVRVVDPEGKLLGFGYYSPKSAIPVRLLSREDEGPFEGAFLGRRIEAAFAFRRDWLGLPNERSTGYRLVNSEGDGLPGLVVDVYDRVARVQLLTAGMKRREQEIYGHLARVAGVSTILEVAVDLEKMEGVKSEGGVARGEAVRDLRFRDRGFEMEIPLEITQKTGFYFDQRDNRAWVEELSRGRRVLDAYCFVGGFGLGAARGGASEVVCLDSSATAIAQGAAIAKHNGLENVLKFVRDDVKNALPDLARKGEEFDIVVVDPPKLAKTVRDLEGARRAYRRLNANALALVAPGGLLVSCSCSSAMRADDLVRTCTMAAQDAKRELVLLGVGEQAPDHPVPSAFEQGRYLKAAFLRVVR